MSKLARAVALVAMLVAMNLAGMTTIAHAQVNQDRIDRHRALGRLELSVAGDHDPRRPPLERQVTSMSRRQPSGAADATLRGCWPASGSPPPTGRPPRPSRPARCGLPRPAGRPAGSPLPWLRWPQRWHWSPGSPCWPPDAPLAPTAASRQLDHQASHP
jgi:hypothetical protein